MFRRLKNFSMRLANMANQLVKTGMRVAKDIWNQLFEKIRQRFRVVTQILFESHAPELPPGAPALPEVAPVLPEPAVPFIPETHLALTPVPGYTPAAPNEIWLKVIGYLPLKSLAKFFQVNKSFAEFNQDNATWRDRALQIEMPLNWGNDEEMLKERFKSFFQECKTVTVQYPPALIETFNGPAKIAALPRLDIGDNVGSTGYLDFILESEVDGHKVMRGQDKVGRPFLTFCVKNNQVRDANNQPQVMVETLFKRYTSPDSHWTTGSSYGEFLAREYGVMDNLTVNYVGRLVRGEPCGKRFQDEDVSARVTDTGQSVIELTDQREFKKQISPQ